MKSALLVNNVYKRYTYKKNGKFVLSDLRIKILPEALWRHILLSQHILSSATIYAGTRGTYCRPKAYEFFALNILSSATIRAKVCHIYIVATYCKHFKMIFR